MAAVFTLTLFICMGIYLDQILASYHETFIRTAGLGLYVEVEQFRVLSDWSEILDKVEECSLIASWNCAGRYIAECDPMDFINVDYRGKLHARGNSESEKNSRIYVYGNLATECTDWFRNGELLLTEGIYPTTDHQGALLDRHLAEANALSIGSVITVGFGNNQTSVSVTGIYEAKQIPKREVIDGYYVETEESVIFLDYQSFLQLTGIDESFNAMVFYADSYQNMDGAHSFIENAIKDIPDSFVSDMVETQEIQMTGVFTILSTMIPIVLMGAFLTAGIILVLLVVMWIRDHDRALAIEMALGQSVWKSIGQIVLEILILSGGTMIAGLVFLIRGCNLESVEFLTTILDILGVNQVEILYAVQNWDYSFSGWSFVNGMMLMECMILAIAIIYTRQFMRRRCKDMLR